MKSWKIIGVMVVVIVLAIGLWWFMQSTPASAAEKVAVEPKPVAPKSTQSAPSGQIAAPKIVPASKTVNSAATATTSDAPAADPQADLKTAIPDIVGLIRAGKEMTLLQTYTRQEKLAAFNLPQIQLGYDDRINDPDPFIRQSNRKTNEDSAEYCEGLESQTPILNAAGDEATYTSDTGLESAYPVTFIKVNGKWYLKGTVYLAPLVFQL